MSFKKEILKNLDEYSADLLIEDNDKFYEGAVLVPIKGGGDHDWSFELYEISNAKGWFALEIWADGSGIYEIYIYQNLNEAEKGFEDKMKIMNDDFGWDLDF